jgi:cellulose synthase/poly-beta-1,6-N-acetylglucosamine synthase-like glycosyltransferase
MIKILSYSLCFSLLVYLYFLLKFYFNLKKHIKISKQNNSPVSVICSAHNEEHNLPNLLNALLSQNYDLNLVQIIIIDDQSSDNTWNILNLFKDKFPNFTCLKSQNRDSVNSPKKNALSQAISLAEHEIILTTDADCIPNPNWINGMVDYYTMHPETDMLIGFSETMLPENEKRFALRFEHFDFHVLMFALAASVYSGKYFTCSGQNLSYKKSAFLKVGGFSKIMHLISGDDLHLMQLFRKNKLNIRFADSIDSYMKTQPVSSMHQLFNQRSRWASNMKYMLISNPEFFIYLLSVFLLLTFIIPLLFLDTKIAILIALIKISCDFIYIRKAYFCFDLKSRLASDFISWTLFQPFYTLIVGVLGSASLFKWKDRKGFAK